MFDSNDINPASFLRVSMYAGFAASRGLPA